METERRRRGLDKSATYHAFVRRHLDDDTKRSLDQVRLAKKAAGNNKFGWDDVVTVCRDKMAGISLAEEIAPSAPKTTFRPAAAPPQTHSYDKPKSKCNLCSKLGLGGDSHAREWCFIDPNSKAYKPEVRERRVAQAKARGIPIPPELEVVEKSAGHNLI